MYTAYAPGTLVRRPVGTLTSFRMTHRQGYNDLFDKFFVLISSLEIQDIKIRMLAFYGHGEFSFSTESVFILIYANHWSDKCNIQNKTKKNYIYVLCLGVFTCIYYCFGMLSLIVVVDLKDNESDSIKALEIIIEQFFF